MLYFASVPISISYVKRALRVFIKAVSFVPHINRVVFVYHVFLFISSSLKQNPNYPLFEQALQI